jgi:hypothetical protein
MPGLSAFGLSFRCRCGSARTTALLSFGLVAKLATQMTFAATLHEITADWTWSGT